MGYAHVIFVILRLFDPYLNSSTIIFLFKFHSICGIISIPAINFLLANLVNFLSFYFRNDETRQPLSRKVSLPSSRINPYRMVIVLRLIILCIFLHYRITNPVRNAYPLWLLSVICEIWFAVSWILDQFPKWFPVNRETYLDRLALRYH
jgi:hypothetical protein